HQIFSLTYSTPNEKTAEAGTRNHQINFFNLIFHNHSNEKTSTRSSITDMHAPTHTESKTMTSINF
ncbi:hypothetical protein, partial [Yersinia enterocolitica]|uniref:hypothetical protein n=1 Tax=Yersinia enterocolitica TaxID=630 RepID=UPI001C60879E